MLNSKNIKMHNYYSEEMIKLIKIVHKKFPPKHIEFRKLLSKDLFEYPFKIDITIEIKTLFENYFKFLLKNEKQILEPNFENRDDIENRKNKEDKEDEEKITFLKLSFFQYLLNFIFFAEECFLTETIATSKQFFTLMKPINTKIPYSDTHSSLHSLIQFSFYINALPTTMKDYFKIDEDLKELSIFLISEFAHRNSFPIPLRESIKNRLNQDLKRCQDKFNNISIKEYYSA